MPRQARRAEPPVLWITSVAPPKRRWRQPGLLLRGAMRHMCTPSVTRNRCQVCQALKITHDETRNVAYAPTGVTRQQQISCTDQGDSDYQCGRSQQNGAWVSSESALETRTPPRWPGHCQFSFTPTGIHFPWEVRFAVGFLLLFT